MHRKGAYVHHAGMDIIAIDRYAEDSEIHRLEELEHENQEVVQAEQPDQIHQVIGEALEAFSRRLRGQRSLHPLL